jgi:F-type H+-transporting ATPase subunit a
LAAVAYFATRRMTMVPGRLQNAIEAFVEAVDDFVCSVLGPRGRKYTPFIGTLFLYILGMNYLGLIPFFKSPTADWSMTMGLALIVFVYVQYTAFKELGLLGYCDHLMGKPRGIMAWSIIMPVFMFALHLFGELVRPFSLSLRLRSNIWGDDMLLAMLAGFGLKGLPVLFFNTLFVVMAATIQAVIFSLLTLIYFALVMVHDEEHA